MTVEVTSEMVEAGVDAINKLRTAERQLQKREDVEMSWADLLSAAYAAMEASRRRRETIDRLMAELREEGKA